jgi:hypothetical protein
MQALAVSFVSASIENRRTNHLQNNNKINNMPIEFYLNRGRENISL